jgi:hypothetical protein
MRKRAAFGAKRLGADPRTAPLASGLLARARALDDLFLIDARLEVDSTRLSAEFGATMERLAEASRSKASAAQLQTLEAKVQALANTDGTLRADRTRLDARFIAEQQAFVTTEALLRIRLSGLE